MKRLPLPPMVAHVLAWAALSGVVFWPFGYSVTTRTALPDGVVRLVIGESPGPFIRYLGPGEVMLLLIPVALTGLAVWLAWPRGARSAWAKLALWGLSVLGLAYCSVPIWLVEKVDISFIGVFFLPAAAALIVSAIVVNMSKPTPDAA